MDGQESSQNPSDILYPECHLNSPIVRGKIAQLHVLLDVNQPYRLKDDSIINITKHKIRNGGLSPRQIKIRSLGKALQRTIKDLDRYTFEPYPTYSQELLRLDIPEICDKIRSVFAVSDRLTRELSSGFQDLWLNIFKQLGNIEGREGYDPLQDISTIPEITDKYSRNRWYRPFLTWFSIKYDIKL